jgi:hypothetical protein
MRRSALVLSILACCVPALTACGGSSDAEVQAKVDAARTEARAQAKQEEKLAAVEDELQELKAQKSETPTRTKTVVERQPAPVVRSAGSGSSGGSSSAARTFHTPTNNVTCRITSSSATCAVAKADMTFGFDGGPARQSVGQALPRGAGSTVGWGGSVSIGSVSCSVPGRNVAAGVTCTDASTGAGFEASAVPARQKAY